MEIDAVCLVTVELGAGDWRAIDCGESNNIDYIIDRMDDCPGDEKINHKNSSNAGLGLPFCVGARLAVFLPQAPANEFAGKTGG